MTAKVNVLFLDNHVEALDKARMDYLGTKPEHVFWKGYDWFGNGSYTED